MKKILISIFCVTTITCALATDYLYWKKTTGEILVHSKEEPNVELDSVYILNTNGMGMTISGLTKKWDENGVGSVAAWVQGAVNTNQLGAITEIEPQDQNNKVDKSSIDIQAVVNVIAEVTGTATNDVEDVFKVKKKDIKKKKKK